MRSAFLLIAFVLVGAASGGCAKHGSSGSAGASPSRSEPATSASASTSKREDDRARCRAIAVAASQSKAIKDLPNANPPRRKGEHHSVWDSGVAQAVYECLAITKDDDALCANLEDEMRARCRLTRGMFHSFRRAPKGAGWRVPENMLESCSAMLHDADLCANVVKALEAGDPARCPRDPRAEIMCRAMASGDARECPEERDAFEPGKEHRAGPKGCELIAATYGAIAKGGLGALEAAGLEEQRSAYAAAALGKPNACEGAVRELEELCVGLATPPAELP